MTRAAAAEISHLTKRFGSTRAVDGVDLTVPVGSVYGILGPNGAGKTTTLRILATLLRPDAGEARVMGYDVVRQADQVRRRICLTGQSASVDQDLTGSENLMLLGRLRGLSRAAAREREAELLDAFDLAAAASRSVRGWSGGMRRRLDIAASLIVAADLLFLDEPTTGLDPKGRREVWDIVRALAAAGTTVLLTTQYLDEADRLSDRIAVFDAGRVIAEGAPTELKASVGSGVLNVRLRHPQQRPEAEHMLAASLDVPIHRTADAALLTARVSDPTRATAALTTLTRSGIALSDFALGQPSLNEVFLALTGAPTPNPGTNQKEDAA
jgi:ABC-2 type transport system ATP-binding protein